MVPIFSLLLGKEEKRKLHLSREVSVRGEFPTYCVRTVVTTEWGFLEPFNYGTMTHISVLEQP